MIEEFTQYVNKFNRGDINIDRKYYHSLRVKSLCQVLAKHIGFSDEDAKIAEVVGLLHDYGRFHQWSLYHTYNDHKSIDHGDYGVEELFEKDQIQNFWTKKEDYDEIYDAIKYHNKIAIPNNLSDHNKKLCKIIRDADKLDIMYLYASESLPFPEEGEIAPKVKEYFDNETLVDTKFEQTDADHGITILALMYDINFNYSFYHLKEYKILDQIYENIKEKEKFKPYFEKINNYIDSKIKEMDKNA